MSERWPASSTSRCGEGGETRSSSMNSNGVSACAFTVTRTDLHRTDWRKPHCRLLDVVTARVAVASMELVRERLHGREEWEGDEDSEARRRHPHADSLENSKKV